MMLRFTFDLDREADTVEQAVKEVLEAGYRTKDIMSDGNILVGTKRDGDQDLRPYQTDSLKREKQREVIQ